MRTTDEKAAVTVEACRKAASIRSHIPLARGNRVHRTRAAAPGRGDDLRGGTLFILASLSWIWRDHQCRRVGMLVKSYRCHSIGNESVVRGETVLAWGFIEQRHNVEDINTARIETKPSVRCSDLSFGDCSSSSVESCTRTACGRR